MSWIQLWMLGQREHSWMCGNKALIQPDSVFQLVSFLNLSALSIKVKCPLSICLSPWAMQEVAHRARPLPESAHIVWSHVATVSFCSQKPFSGQTLWICQELSDLGWKMTAPFTDCKWAHPHCRPLMKCTGKAKVGGDTTSNWALKSAIYLCPCCRSALSSGSWCAAHVAQGPHAGVGTEITLV